MEFRRSWYTNDDIEQLQAIHKGRGTGLIRTLGCGQFEYETPKGIIFHANWKRVTELIRLHVTPCICNSDMLPDFMQIQ